MFQRDKREYVYSIGNSNIPFESFYPGITYTLKSPKKIDNPTITVGPCNKLYIDFVSIWTRVNVPFTASILWTNGVTNYTETVKGSYRTIPLGL